MADKKEADKSLFGKKRHLSRLEFREKLRKAPSNIPGARKRYGKKERVMLEEELFGDRYGSYISREEYQRRLRELEREKYRTNKVGERIALERKIKYLEELAD